MKHFGVTLWQLWVYQGGFESLLCHFGITMCHFCFTLGNFGVTLGHFGVTLDHFGVTLDYLIAPRIPPGREKGKARREDGGGMRDEG